MTQPPFQPLIIDAHMHLWDRVHGSVHNDLPVSAVGNGLIRIGEDELLGMPAWMLDCRALAEHFVAEMDTAGVSAAVIVQEYLDGEQNDYLLEVVKRYPDRFFMHGLPNWFDPDQVASEIEGLLTRDFGGIKIPAHHLIDQISLDDERLLPAYDLVDCAGAVLAVDLSEGEGQVTAMRSVLEKHPTMKVALGHFGMPTRKGWPGQLDLCNYDNVYLEMGGMVWLYRDDGCRFERAIDAILEAMDRVGVDKLMWGSDWPRTMVDFTYDQSLGFLRDTDRIDQKDKAKLLGQNAQRFYGLSGCSTSLPRQPRPRITEG